MSAYNSSFILFFCLFVVAAFCCAPVLGGSGIIPVLIAGYFMLVSVNSISRGEKRARKSKGKRKA